MSAGAAGTRVRCTCGREIAVPTLGALRRLAGEEALSPNLVIEHMLARGEWPEGDRCVLCETATDHVAYFWANCERAEERRPGWRGWTIDPLSIVLFLFGWLYVWRSNEVQVLGHDVNYRLPLRVCLACARELRGTAEIKRALAKVPVYRQLLEKYPEATVSAAPRATGLAQA